MKNLNIPCPRLLIPFAAIGLLGAMAGCNVIQPAQEDPTRYFILSDPSSQAAQAPSVAGGLRIGLRAVRLEGYLKRREMVVRTGENEIEFKDYRRWAEPLDAAIARVVRYRLLAAPEVALVSTEPFPADQERDFDVAIEVRRCEGSAMPSGKYEASLSAWIEVSTSGASPHVVARKLFVAPGAAWDGTDFDRLAKLLTEDASALGKEVLSDIPPRS